MAQFIMLFRGGLATSGDASPEVMQAHYQKWMAWSDQLRESNAMTGQPLEGGGMTIKGPNKSVTDGPYAESKDLTSGFMLIEAASLAEATEIAKGCPIFEDNDTGSVEVRPVADMGS